MIEEKKISEVTVRFLFDEHIATTYVLDATNGDRRSFAVEVFGFIDALAVNEYCKRVGLNTEDFLNIVVKFRTEVVPLTYPDYPIKDVKMGDLSQPVIYKRKLRFIDKMLPIVGEWCERNRDNIGRASSVPVNG